MDQLKRNSSNYFENTIIISVGDESGVGPEIILKALASNQIPQNVRVRIVGSKQNLINTYSSLKSIGIESQPKIMFEKMGFYNKVKNEQIFDNYQDCIKLLKK